MAAIDCLSWAIYDQCSTITLKLMPAAHFRAKIECLNHNPPQQGPTWVRKPQPLSIQPRPLPLRISL
jgi:hypothetical protein